jgi:multiple sugar transport system permease protein
MSTSSLPVYLRQKRTPLRLTLTIVGWVVISLIALFVVFPFLWMILTSFKTEKDVFSLPGQLPFARLFLNSVIFAGGVTVISVVFDSFAAYALARLDFPGKNIAFYLVIATLMVPYQITLIPLFQELFNLHWLDSYQGLIVPRATSAFGIFLLRQFFVSIPRDLDSAARLDGASEFRIYAQIMMPLAKPALATLAVFQFMNNWNDFLWPLVVTSSTDMRTIPAGLTLFGGQYVVDYAVLMAGATISLLPLGLAFFFAQRYFVQGIATTGIK